MSPKSFFPGREHLTAMMRLALPLIVVQVGIRTFGVVDSIMCGHLSGRAMAAVGLGGLYHFALMIFAIGVLKAIDPLVSQGVGARDVAGVRLAVQRAILLAALMSVPAAAPLLFSESVLLTLRQPAEVVTLSADYTRTLIPGVLPFLIYTVLQFTLQAHRRVAPVVWGILLCNVLNVFLDWVLIYGKLGFPALGVVGAAWASVVCRWVMVGTLVVFSMRELGPNLRLWTWQVIAPRPLGRTIALGIPIGGQHFLEFGLFASITMMMGTMGEAVLAAHQIAINLASITFTAALGLSSATAVLVGQAIGAGQHDRSRRCAGAGIIFGTALMLCGAATFTAFPTPLASVFTTEAPIVAVAVTFLPVAAMFQVADGLQVITTAILRGAGDVRVPFLLHLVGFWIIGFPVCYLLGFHTDLGAHGLWWGLVISLTIIAASLLWRTAFLFRADIERTTA